MAEIETDAIEIDSEPVEEPEVEVMNKPAEAPEGEVDSSKTDIEAEVLFQVAHYVDEYGGPASLADVAFEIQEKDTDVHKALEKAVKEGTPKVKPAIKSLLDQGLKVETEYGGYITTEEGDKMLGEPEVQGELGDTYESDKNQGDPAGEGEAGELGVPADVEEFDTEGKDEMGVPFLP